MRFDLRWLVVLALGAVVSLACQAQGPFDPDIGISKQTQTMGGAVQDLNLDPDGNFGHCVSQCQERRHVAFKRCVDRGGDPNFCAARADRQADQCVRRCRQQCQADCEKLRQRQFQQCLDDDRDPNACAARANRRARLCKERCDGGLKGEV